MRPASGIAVRRTALDFPGEEIGAAARARSSAFGGHRARSRCASSGSGDPLAGQVSARPAGGGTRPPGARCWAQHG